MAFPLFYLYHRWLGIRLFFCNHRALDSQQLKNYQNSSPCGRVGTFLGCNTAFIFLMHSEGCTYRQIFSKDSPASLNLVLSLRKCYIRWDSRLNWWWYFRGSSHPVCQAFNAASLNKILGKSLLHLVAVINKRDRFLSWRCNIGQVENVFSAISFLPILKGFYSWWCSHCLSRFHTFQTGCQRCKMFKTIKNPKVFVCFLCRLCLMWSIN